MPARLIRAVIPLVLSGLFAAAAPAAMIGDFGIWTLIEDLPHDGMSGAVDSPTEVTLTASGPVPSGTDIGYASVGGNTVALSTGGFFFSPANDFSIAVDFNLSHVSSVGGGAIGFGIGEEASGENSAGIVLAFSNGVPLGVAGAGRVADVDQGGGLSSWASTSGRFFVDYDASTGDVGFGVSATPGSSSAEFSDTLGGIQGLWNGDPLLVSFFLRSQEYPLPFPLPDVPPLTSGVVTAEFSNFEVLSGTAMSVVPLPSSAWLLGGALGALAGVRRRGRLIADWKQPAA